MGDILSRNNMFPEKLVKEIFSKVKGKSSIAKICGQTPMSFNGNKEFTFTMDKEIDIVAENGAKGKGGATIAPVTIIPIKVEYGARISDEFMYATEEEALPILETWIDGFQKKVAKGLDLMAFHGINPRTGAASNIIGNNHFDYAITNYKSGKNKIVYGHDQTEADTNVDELIALLEDDGYTANGIVIAPIVRSAIARMTANGARKYPEFAWGAVPNNLGEMTLDSNSTLSANASKDRILVGDFSAFKWGYAKQMPIEVIEYGNPDNDPELGDLKGHNQVYLRSEAYIGWGILDAAAFGMAASANG